MQSKDGSEVTVKSKDGMLSTSGIVPSLNAKICQKKQESTQDVNPKTVSPAPVLGLLEEITAASRPKRTTRMPAKCEDLMC